MTRIVFTGTTTTATIAPPGFATLWTGCWPEQSPRRPRRFPPRFPTGFIPSGSRPTTYRSTPRSCWLPDGAPTCRSRSGKKCFSRSNSGSICATSGCPTGRRHAPLVRASGPSSRAMLFGARLPAGWLLRYLLVGLVLGLAWRHRSLGESRPMGPGPVRFPESGMGLDRWNRGRPAGGDVGPYRSCHRATERKPAPVESADLRGGDCF